MYCATLRGVALFRYSNTIRQGGCRPNGACTIQIDETEEFARGLPTVANFTAIPKHSSAIRSLPLSFTPLAAIVAHKTIRGMKMS